MDRQQATTTGIDREQCVALNHQRSTWRHLAQRVDARLTDNFGNRILAKAVACLCQLFGHQDALHFEFLYLTAQTIDQRVSLHTQRVVVSDALCPIT